MTIQAKYTPEELKILVDALNQAPAYLSKRFILMHLCGWTKQMVEDNVKMKNEELAMMNQGDKVWR